jgi:hypothetical protein
MPTHLPPRLPESLRAASRLLGHERGDRRGEDKTRQRRYSPGVGERPHRVHPSMFLRYWCSDTFQHSEIDRHETCGCNREPAS